MPAAGGEVVRRAEGHSLPDFITRELSEPLGLPDLAFGLGRRDVESVAYSYWLGKDTLEVAGVNVAAGFEERNNSLSQFDSMNPAVSLVTNAASLAATASSRAFAPTSSRNALTLTRHCGE